ncbi:MAG: NAD-dependent DNA ligase LigA [Treponema sp.]|nr:NAD-dependent DNA ligase LigA [Treponema sp.]
MQKRIAELSGLIQRYQNSYYNGEGEVSDAEFDALWDELKRLDPANPLLQRVGQDSGNFAKLHHVMPMGSQEKAADPEAFLEWASKHVYNEYLVEYKLDGASLELQYEHGELVYAVTRGDGSVGDDITVNAKKMHGVQLLLLNDGNRMDFTGGVRGEVIMTHAVHDALYADKANCRNAANGLMKRKDGTGSEHLTLIVYDALSRSDPQPFKDEEEKIQWLRTCGFTTVPLHICKTPQEVIDYRAQVMDIRKSLEYDIDGLVIKERVINRDDAQRTRPDRQIAFKFSLEEAVSVLRSVDWSESGVTYTPVAVFDPVELAGTTVKRASLANPDTIRALKIQLGSRIVVVKRGEIIPKIEAVLPMHEEDTVAPIVYPTVCSVCGTPLVDDGSRLYCPNHVCPKKIHHQLLKWISVVDIRDFGETLVTALYKDGRLTSITDIYTLTKEELTPYFLTQNSIDADKKSLGAEKVIKSIQAHTSLPLSTYIAGFDIEGIGEANADKLIAAGFDTLDKLLAATEEELASVYGFADVMAKTMVAGLKENAAEMRSLIASGYITVQQGEAMGILTGKSFCFTGELHTMKRLDAQNMVKQAGGTIKSSVTKDLSYLVTNDTTSGSSKNKKASQLGITILSEEAFLQLFHTVG